MDLLPPQIVRSKRKSIAIRITEDLQLIVKAPKRAPLYEIQRILKKYESWINKKKNEIAQRPKRIQRKYASGESFLFLGKNHELFADGEGDSVKALLIAWYQHKAEAIILERGTALSAAIGFKPASIKLSDAKTRWGSCSPKGNVKMSWRLIMAPLEVIDYVIVHELVHLAEKNHGKRFWYRVEALMPEYRQRRRWLRFNQSNLEI